METIKAIVMMNVLIAGLDVKLGTVKKRALYKKENESYKKESRILREKKEKRKNSKDNVIPKESAHYKLIHHDILPLCCVPSLSPPHLGHLPVVEVEGEVPGHDPQARADAVIALALHLEGDSDRSIASPDKKELLTRLTPGPGQRNNNHISTLRPVVSPGGGSEGGDEDGDEPAAQQTPGQSAPRPGTTQLSVLANHYVKVGLSIVTVETRVTRQVCQVTNYDKQQMPPERVCLEVDSLIFTCETKFTTLHPSVDCDIR